MKTRHSFRERFALSLVAAVLVFSLAAGAVLADPGITPATVQALIYPGQSAAIAKTVTTPAIPPKPDIYLLTDSTGSMGDVIAGVQANAATVLTQVKAQTTDPRFGAGDYKDFLSGDPYAFRNGASIPASDDGGAAALAAIGAWSAGGGLDGPEAQFFALDQIASGVVGFRSNSTRIVVWFGDAPGHDPICAAASGLPYSIDEASLTAKLVAAKVRVIAISVVTASGAFYPNALDDNPTAFGGDYLSTCGVEGGTPGQASRIAAATGGEYLSGVNADQIANAILKGLTNLPADVAMASDCAAPISTTFSPASQTVTSGTNASFAETVSVAAGAAGGTYTCKDWALINGQPMTDATGNVIYESKTINVPGIALQPPTATNELLPGATHTVIATVTAGSAGAVAGVRIQFSITAGPHKGVTGTGTTDANGKASFTYGPGATVSPADLGTDTIVASFTSPDGTIVFGSATATKTWVDTTPPIASCVPTVNPAGKTVPNAPGNGGRGQNQDGFYEASGKDIVWPASALKIFVTDTGSGTVFGPYSSGVRIKYTQAPGATPSVTPMGGPGSAVAWHIIGTGDAQVTAVDGSGNVSKPAACLVPPPPK